MAKNVIFLIVAFLLGSIPFGIITAKAKGIDLKKVGSGNIGATNVLRALGKWPAVITLIGDMGKGALAVALGRHGGVDPLVEGLIGISAILGHNFSIFLRFRGGKGVATSIGVLLFYLPREALVTIAIWLVVVFFTRYSSLGALVAFGLLPFSVCVFEPGDWTKVLIATLISALIIVRHRENIDRLIRGSERKIGRRT